MADGIAPRLRSRRLRLMSRSPLFRARLRQVEQLLGPTNGLACLDVGGDAGLVSLFLRARGGTWSSVETPGPAFEALEAAVGERAYALGADGSLPFEKNTFDGIVVVDLLEHLADDAHFIRECHRVLKPAGRLVVQVPHYRSFAPLRGLRAVLGFADDRIGHVRPGYSAPHLFDVLKDGFDVQEVKSYSRFFAEAAELLGHALAGRGDAGWDMAGLSLEGLREETFRRLRAHWGFFHALAWFGAQLDRLLLFSRGYRLIVRAKRRLWIPRKTPILRDGRSIAEATLGTRIGTASPLASVSQPPSKESVRARR